MLKTNELDINYFVKLAEAKEGFIGDLEFQSNRADAAGKFEIIKFEKLEEPKFRYSFWRYAEEDTPNRADVGIYTVKLSGTKFYNGRVLKFKVSAYVQDEDGVNDRLYISNTNEATGKTLRAYQFPILNW